MNSNPQWWLKSHTFVITSTLDAYIKSRVIPDEEAQYLCYVQNKVITGCNRTETDERGYIRVSRRVWLDKCGMHYPQWLDLLSRIGELEIDHSYHFLPDDASPDDKHNFIPKCKGYKVPFDKITQGLVRIDFKKKQVHPMKSQTLDDASLKSDLHIYHIMACLKEVIVAPEPIFPDDPLRYAMAKQYLEKVHYKAFGLHRAKTGRVFHAIIEMPKEGRINLRHSSGEPLVDIDVKTCHPHLLLPLFSDKNEQANFYNNLQGDIYTLINPHDDRDKVKARFSQYIGQKNRDAEWLANTDVHSFFVTIQVLPRHSRAGPIY